MRDQPDNPRHATDEIRTAWYDGHRVGYLAALARIWEFQSEQPPDPQVTKALDLLADSVRRSYDRVRRAAEATEEGPNPS